MPKDEVSSAVPKTYPHVPPRIDPEWYQAEIPLSFEGPLPAEAVQTDWFDSTRKIYSNDVSKETKKNFLLHTRNLFERRKLGVSRQVGDEPPVVWKKEQISFPLESDEAAIEFLAKHDYDLNKAKFYLACILSGGRDVVHARRMRQQLAKLPGASITERLKTIFFEHNHVWMHGTYANHSGTGEYITDASGEGLLFLPDFGTCEPVDTPKSGSSVALMSQCFPQPHSDVDSSINVHKYEVNAMARDEEKWGASVGPARRKMHTQDPPSSPSARSNSSSSASSSTTNDQDLEDSNARMGGNGIALDKPQRDKSITDKSATKKKWSQISKTAASFMASVNSSYGGVSRSSLEAVHEHLAAAFAALPMPSEGILGAELTTQLNAAVPKVVEHYVLCKEWIGEVYDTLCPLALASNEVTPCDYKIMQKLLREGEGLPFRCTFEENQLKRVIKDIGDLVQQSQGILMLATNSASALSSNLFDNHLVDTFDSKQKGEGGSARNRSKVSGKSTKRNLSAKDREEVKLSNLLASDMQAINEDKIDIYELNNLLLAFSCLPHHISNLPNNFTCQWEGAALARSSDTPTYPTCSSCYSSLVPSADGITMASHWDSFFLSALKKQKQQEHQLQKQQQQQLQGETSAGDTLFPTTAGGPQEASHSTFSSPLAPASDVDTLQLLYLGAVELNSQLDHVLSMATMILHKKYTSKTQASLSSLTDLFLRAASYPVQLFGLEDVQRIITLGVEWNEEVVQACKPNAPLLSLNRLEALIAEGEKLPIDFAKELEALREKRGAGKTWLEKFRKSMNSSGGVSRASREGGGGGGKMDLQSMKQLIEEGGQLYEDRKNKELGKAMNVVDEAEEMLSRVRDIISGGSSSSAEAWSAEGAENEEEEEDESRDLELLKELLADTESMPVAMEEVQLLRAHIETVEWAEKARPILRMDLKKSKAKSKAKTSDVDNESDNESDEGDVGSSRGGTSPRKRYRVSTLLKLQKDLLKTRASMSSEMKKQFQAIKFKLPEETKLQTVLTMIEKFQNKVKKRFSSCGSGADDLFHRNSTLRSSVTLSAVRQMIVDMNAILALVDLDFDNESYHLHTHVNAAEGWLRQHQDTLQKLDIQMVSMIEGEASRDDNTHTEDDDENDDEGERSSHVDTNMPQESEVNVKEEVSTTNYTDDKPVMAVNVLEAIDNIDEGSLIEYDTLFQLIESSTEGEAVLTCFPELSAAKMRLEDVDSWLAELQNHKPSLGDVTRTRKEEGDEEEEDKRAEITSTELEAMIATGLEYKVNLLDEMRRVRGWIRQAEQWEVDAQPAFAAILQTVEDSLQEFRSALTVPVSVTAERHSGDSHSYIRIPFLEGLENPLDEFEHIFSLNSDDLQSCLKYPSSTTSTSTATTSLYRDDLMDEEPTSPATRPLTTPKQLEEAFQPIIRLHRTMSASISDLMTERRQQVGGIILTYSPNVASEVPNEEATANAPINLGALLATLSRLMQWIEQIEFLLTASDGNGQSQWGDISEETVLLALEDISKLVPLDQLQEMCNEYYHDTLLHDSIPREYFHASSSSSLSSSLSSHSNDDKAEEEEEGNDDDNDREDGPNEDAVGCIDVVEEEFGTRSENITADTTVASPRSKRSRTSKSPSSFASNKRQAIKKSRDDASSTSSNGLGSKEFPFEKHSTRKSNKKNTTAASSGSSSGGGGVDESLLAASSSPVAAALLSLYHSYTYPEYRPVQFSTSSKKQKKAEFLLAASGVGTKQSVPVHGNSSTKVLPTPVLQLVDLWVRMLKLLLVRKEEASLFISVADSVVKQQVSEKAYKGVRSAPASRINTTNTTLDPLYRPIWQVISFTASCADRVRCLVLWGTKRNIALRTRRVIDQRFGQSNLWQQVAQVYVSQEITSHIITTSSSQYLLKPLQLPLTPSASSSAVDPNSSTGIHGDNDFNPFAQLLQPLADALLLPLKKEFPKSETSNEKTVATSTVESDPDQYSSSTPVVNTSTPTRCDHYHLLENHFIPRLSLEEMQLFIHSAEAGGGLLPAIATSESETDSDTHGSANSRKGEMTPLRLLKELLILSQPLLFRQPALIHQLKDNVRTTKDWIERFHRLQEIQQLQAAGAQTDDLLPATGGEGALVGGSSKQGGGKEVEEPAALNVNELCNQLIAETQSSVLRGNGIDLSTYLEQIMQVTQVYCLCRLPFHGFMVGCDHCEDWLHGPCIGLTKVQADRTDKYTCIRCMIKASANVGFQSIASIVLLWMAPEDAIKHLETKRYRVTKKVSKEEIELNQLLAQLPLLQNHLQTLRESSLTATSPAIAPSDDTKGSEQSAFSTSMEVSTAKLKKLEEDIVTARGKLQKALHEEVEIKKFYTLDVPGRLAWNQWMVRVRDMLWPKATSNSSVSSSSASNSSSSVGGMDRIPIEADILHATHQARELGIIDFPDVVNILNSFRWVSYCYLTLSLLRGPPTVKQIQSVLSVTKKLKIGYMDEKMLRSITGLLNRTRAWKSKCKKVLASSTTVSSNSGGASKNEDRVFLIDENKAKALYDESTLCMSVRTRLRDQLRDALNAHNMSKDDKKTSNDKDNKGKSAVSVNPGNRNANRGAQKFSVKEIMAASNEKQDISNAKLVKLVLPALYSAKTGKVTGYYSSDEEDSDHEEEDTAYIAASISCPVSEIDRAVYRHRLPSQRHLNPIPQHSLSAPMSQAIAYPPTLTPTMSPFAKSYQPQYKHIHLPTSSSFSKMSRGHTVAQLLPSKQLPTSATTTAATVTGKPSGSQLSSSFSSSVLKKEEHNKAVPVTSTVTSESSSVPSSTTTHPVVTNSIASTSSSACTTTSDSSSDAADKSSAAEVIVTPEMLQDSLLQVSQIMSSEQEELKLQSSGSCAPTSSTTSSTDTVTPLTSTLNAGNNLVAAGLTLPTTATGTSGPKPKKEKREKKEPKAATEKKPRVMKKDKDPSTIIPRGAKGVKGDVKKAAMKAVASGESRKRQKITDEKARALLKSITGATATSGPLLLAPTETEGDGSPFVPKTIADALQMGKNFVEKKRQQGVEALKNSINASISAKNKRKQGDIHASAPSSTSSVTTTTAPSASSTGEPLFALSSSFVDKALGFITGGTDSSSSSTSLPSGTNVGGGDGEAPSLKKSRLESEQKEGTSSDVQVMEGEESGLKLLLSSSSSSSPSSSGAEKEE